MIRRSLNFTESESGGGGPNELAAERAAIRAEMLAVSKASQKPSLISLRQNEEMRKNLADQVKELRIEIEALQATLGEVRAVIRADKAQVIDLQRRAK